MAVSAQEQARESASLSINKRHFPHWLVLSAFLLLTLGCSVADLLARPTDTPVPTRALAATFTATPATVQSIIIVTPPHDGTPGFIIIPPGMDPNQVIPTPPTPTPLPPSGGTPGQLPPPGNETPGNPAPPRANSYAIAHLYINANADPNALYPG